MIDNAVIDVLRLVPQELSLYTVLARHVNHKTGWAWPSLRRLSELTGLARGTVIKYLRSLEEKNLIFVLRRWRRDKKQRLVNLYRLLDPRAPETSPLPPEDVLQAAFQADYDEESSQMEMGAEPGRGGSGSEPGVVQAVNQDGSSRGPQVVQAVDRNKKNRKKTRSNQIDLNERRAAQRTKPETEPIHRANQNGSATTSVAASQKSILPPKGKNDWQEFCQRLADVCQIDFEANQGKIRRFASSLWKHGDGYTVEDLNAFKLWWYNQDWRGQKGDVPRLHEVAEGIRMAVEVEERKEEADRAHRYRYISGELAAYIQY
jgi:hypothetical protein